MCRRPLRLLAIPLLLTSSCATWNPVDYGVQPGEPIGYLRSINELPDSEIERICGPKRAGCVRPDSIYPSNVWDLYYREGDDCALRHELMHIMYGLHHTVRYQQRLIQGDPRPYCP